MAGVAVNPQLSEDVLEATEGTGRLPEVGLRLEAEDAGIDRDESVGKRVWVIAEGYIPGESNGPEPAMTSHETACILNAGALLAEIEITAFFADRDPAGPYRITVPARRTLHLRFNELRDPEPIARDTDYSSVLRSSVPIVVQHTRLDSRQPPHALLSTIAWGQ